MYIIKSLVKEKEKDESDEDTRYTFTEKYIITDLTFTIDNPYIFIDKEQSVTFKISQ